MLSIIICSIRPQQLKEISENIARTVGIPYELVAIDNREKPRGITAVYNEGARKAKFEHLCFVHEDVEFKSKNWGKNLVEHLQNPKVGLLGIAGGKYKPKVPSGWGAQGLEHRLIKINLIQHYKAKDLDPQLHYLNKQEETLSQVACVDGVFMATKKSVVMEIPFEENLLKGFHGYDIDFSIAVNQKYQVFVCFDILLEHFSEGSFSKDWIDSTLLIHRKWQHVLPINIGDLSKKDMIICEKRTFRFVARIFRKHSTLPTILQALQLSALKQLDYINYLKMYLSIARIYLSKNSNS
jgi:hypothetical protein